jgi:uncharacterized repeat protein (TIGR01451 family)
VTDRDPRWNGAILAAVALTWVGIVYTSAAVLLGALVPLAYVAYDALGTTPPADTVSVSRSLSTTRPVPDDTVAVTLTVTNDGDTPISDVRVLDGVPDSIALVDGTARGAFALDADESATLSYTVRAVAGTYTFDDPAVRCRSLSGGQRTTATVPATGDCRFETDAVPPTTDTESGPAGTGTGAATGGGRGTEFYATREYRPGDPLSRIDWRRYARTGTLGAIEYSEHTATQAAVVVDARPVARVAARAGGTTGAELAITAGARLTASVAASGDSVAVGAVGLDTADTPEPIGTDGVFWAAADGPWRPETVFEAASRVATTAPDETLPDWDEPDVTPDDAAVRRIRDELSRTTAVFVATPVLDRWPVALARQLTALGNPVTVVAPDVTTDDTPGSSLAGHYRERQLEALRDTPARVVDWQPDEPLAIEPQELERRTP